MASVYFNLSLRYALIGSRPLVLICMGRIGTGKSTIAKHLGKTLNVDVYSSDRIRKEMAGLPLHERTPTKERNKLYSADMSRKTYDALWENAKQSVSKGKSVILDATFSLAHGRQNLVSQLESIGADYLFIEAQASDDVVKSRLENREGDSDCVSDARLEDFEMLTEKYEEPEEIDSNHKIEINTGKPLKDTIDGLYKKLVERQFDVTSTV